MIVSTRHVQRSNVLKQEKKERRSHLKRPSALSFFLFLTFFIFFLVTSNWFSLVSSPYIFQTFQNLLIFYLGLYLGICDWFLNRTFVKPIPHCLWGLSMPLSNLFFSNQGRTFFWTALVFKRCAFVSVQEHSTIKCCNDI